MGFHLGGRIKVVIRASPFFSLLLGGLVAGHGKERVHGGMKIPGDRADSVLTILLKEGGINLVLLGNKTSRKVKVWIELLTLYVQCKLYHMTPVNPKFF